MNVTTFVYFKFIVQVNKCMIFHMVITFRKQLFKSILSGHQSDLSNLTMTKPLDTSMSTS